MKAAQEHSGESLFDVLEKKNSSLASQVRKIKERGLKDWVGLLQPDRGSHAGYPHLLNVERLADKIVPDSLKDDLSEGELFLLLSAIFLHDIGKIIPFPGPEAPCNLEPGSSCTSDSSKKVNDPGEEPYDENIHPPCRKPSWGHHIQSERIIRRYGVALGLPDERIAQYCGLIAFCHCLKEPPDKVQLRFGESSDYKCEEDKLDNFRTTSLVSYGVLRIPLLAAIVRIADETDNLWTRAVGDYWRDSLSKTQENLGKAFRRYIEDIEFSHEGECLIIHITELENANDNGNGSKLSDESIESINRARTSISGVIKSGWGELLKTSGDIRLREVYIERANHLYKELDTSLEQPSLGEILDEKEKVSLQALLNAAIKLALGGYGHHDFSWMSFEAQVGKPLTDFEKWLTLRMGSITPDFRIIGNLRTEDLRIEIKNNGDIAEIKKAIIGSWGDDEEEQENKARLISRTSENKLLSRVRRRFQR
jgi:hypothetical protein